MVVHEKEALIFQNQLLREILSPSNIAGHLLPEFRVVPLALNQVLYEQGDHVKYVYFPLDSVLSTLAIMEDGTTVETSLIGREGCVGISTILGRGISQQWVWVTVGGSAIQFESKFLDTLCVESEAALKAVLGCYRSLITQTAQRGVCNSKHSLLERLSCWLLMIHDRTGGTNLNLTQELMASRVGARRSGITVAARVLLEMKAIAYRRGRLTIEDRRALEEVVCECYRTTQTDFTQLRPIAIPR